MTLREKQSLFLVHSLALMQRAITLGYEVTYGDTHRSKQECERLGFLASLHGKRLAIDLHLFLEGRYLRTTEAHRELGEWWEQQHPLARWGGRFGDGNHYSFEHGGVK